MTKVNLAPSPGQTEFTIRKGEALPPKPQRSILISGTLGAPFQFLSGKPDIIEPKNIHLQISNAKGELVLHMGDQDPHTEHIIKGALTKNNVLLLFGINTERRWSIREFVKFIKTMRYYFADRAAHTALVDSVQKWSVKVERAITEFNDMKGNSNYQLETKVQAVEGLVTKFDLNIPIFQGYSNQKFTVEIGLDPKNTSVDLFLISDELIELEIGHREALLSQELKNFDAYTFSKVVID